MAKEETNELKRLVEWLHYHLHPTKPYDPTEYYQFTDIIHNTYADEECDGTQTEAHLRQNLRAGAEMFRTAVEALKQTVQDLKHHRRALELAKDTLVKSHATLQDLISKSLVLDELKREKANYAKLLKAYQRLECINYGLIESRYDHLGENYTSEEIVEQALMYSEDRPAVAYRILVQ
jgi:hypothetical protein